MVDKFACSAGEGLADDCPCQGDQVPVAGRCAPVSVVLAAVLVPSSLLAAAVVWLLRKVREERERNLQTLRRRRRRRRGESSPKRMCVMLRQDGGQPICFKTLMILRTTSARGNAAASRPK